MLSLFNALSTEVIRAVTGRLFTDAEIRQVSTHAIGRYLSDFFPEPGSETAARERVEDARTHMAKASEIILQLQTELGSQTQQLDKILAEIEEKKQIAHRYETLAKTGKDQFDAFKLEMEAALRSELANQSEQGKTLRRFASAILWIITLVLGAALGTYFKEVLAWVRAIAV